MTFDPNAFAKESRKNFPANLHKAIAWVQEVNDLHAAQRANNKTHGYDKPYHDPGYVQYPQRADEWKAVDRVINNRFDTLNDENHELEWKILVVLHALPYAARKELNDLIDKYLPIEADPA